MNDQKGLFMGNCNRTACQKPLATWYNHSTEKYYCPACARLINQGCPEFKAENCHEICTPKVVSGNII